MNKVISNDPLGVSLDDLGGIRSDQRLISGIDCLVSDLIARLLGPCPLFEAVEPGYGIDLESYILDEITIPHLIALGTEIESQLMRDPRVKTVDCLCTYENSTKTIYIEVNGSSYDNRNFSFIGNISNDTRPTFLPRDS